MTMHGFNGLLAVCFTALAVLISPFGVAQAQQPGAAARPQIEGKTRELFQLLKRVTETADPEEKISLLEAAVKLEAQIESWSLPVARNKVHSALFGELGHSYYNRLQGSRAENLEKAIAAYEAALIVYTREAFPEQWAATQNNLASAYSDRIRGERAENLEKAIAAYEAALSVYTREAFPEQWATTQNNRAAAYSHRIRGERAENLEKAIAAYEAALSVRTREAFPQDWAATQNNLANAYSHRIRGERAENLEKAIAAYEAALSVYTREAFARYHLRTGHALGNVFLQKRQWRQASAALAGAREAFLLLFGEGLNDAEARDLINEAGTLFIDAASAAAQSGDPDSALQLLDEGKARMLNVALKLNSLNLDATGQERLQTLRGQIRDAEAATQQVGGIKRMEGLLTLGRLRAELLQLINEADARSKLDGGHSALVRAANVVPEGGALVAPILTKAGGKLLVVTVPNGKAKIQAVDLPQFDDLRLRELLAGDDGWFRAYLFASLLHEDTKFRATVDGIGLRLWQAIGQALTEVLAAEGVKPGARLVILPQGMLGVLPLGLAQDPANNERLGSIYDISYAPSIEALQGAQDTTTAPPTLAAAINPENNLPFAAVEGALVASRFAPAGRSELANSAATRDAVLAALKGKTYWHFASHGAFSWDDARQSRLRMAHGVPLTVGTLMETQGLGKPRLVVLSACETGLTDVLHAPV